MTSDYLCREPSGWVTRIGRLPVSFVSLWIFLTLFCSQTQAQSPYIVGDFPIASGIVVLNAGGGIQTFYPISGSPSDIDVFPTQSHFAVVTQSGKFMIFSSQGEEVFTAAFESLSDVDSLQTDPNRFLLTSRTGKRVFFFDRNSGDQQTVPFTFQGPTDADLLPNGNLLVCDALAGQIVEITPQGEPVWSYQGDLKQPVDALRLPGGETMISDFDNHRVLVVSPSGEIKKDIRGFDHPIKLTLLEDRSVLVADADQQEIEIISPQWEHRVFRKNMNYIQSIAYSASYKVYLCAVQQKFSPPVQPNNILTAVKQKQTGAFAYSRFLLNPFVLLVLVIALSVLSGVTTSYPLLQKGTLFLSFLLLFGILYAGQTRSASSADHRLTWAFWLGCLVLSAFVYRDAKSSYWTKERWPGLGDTWSFPLNTWRILAFVFLPVISLFTQYYHLRVTPFGWSFPWYIPMIVWGAMVFGLYRALIQNQNSEDKEHSVFQLGSVTLAVPFTTGSVSLEEPEGARDGATESELEKRLIVPWANTVFILVLILGAALYSIYSTSVPTDVHGDEGEVALYAAQIRESGNWNIFNVGWYNIPNLFYLIPGWVMWLFGDNLFGVRMAGALTGLSCIPVFYLLARRILRPGPSAIAVFLFATSSYMIHFSRLGIGYNQTALITLAVMYGFVRGLQDRDLRWLAMAGVLSAIGVLSYQASKILLPLTVLSFGLLWMTRVLSARAAFKGLSMYILAFWVGIAPLTGLYLSASGAAFSRAKSVTLLSTEGEQFIRRGYPPDISYKQLLINQIERTVLAPVTYHDNSPYISNQNNGGMLDSIPAILFVAGFFLLIASIAHPVSRLLLLWIICIPFAGSVLTDHAPSYQRLVGVLPFLLLVAAPVLHGCLRRFARVFGWLPRHRLHITTAILILLMIFSMHRYFHQIMSKPQVLDEWTRIARFLDSEGPNQYTYFLGPPHVYFQYGTIRFLAQEAKGEDVLKPQEFVKNRVIHRGPVCFLLVRNNRRYINDLRRLYPGGREENHYNLEGGSPFITYVVNL